LPYGDGRYNMVALMPASGRTLQEVVDELEPQHWLAWQEAFTPVDGLELYFPKFRFEFEKKLNELLIAQGMGLAFTPGLADLSLIHPTLDLYIDEVKHKTFIDVNEKGTEAAAVTSVGIGVTSVGSYLMFNQPFLFFIVEKYSGFVVFSGVVGLPAY